MLLDDVVLSVTRKDRLPTSFINPYGTFHNVILDCQRNSEVTFFAKVRELGDNVVSNGKRGIANAFNYEMAHGRFWNALNLPGPIFFEGVISAVSTGVLMEDLGAPLSHHVLAIRKEIQKRVDSLSKVKTLQREALSAEVSYLKSWLELLVYRTIDTMVEFAVEGSWGYFDGRLADKPPMDLRRFEYYKRRFEQYIRQLKSESESQKQKAIACFSDLESELILPLISQKGAVYGQRDEFLDNMAAVGDKEKQVEVKMLDAGNAGFGRLPHSLAKFLLNSLFDFSYGQILEKVEYAHKLFYDRFKERGGIPFDGGVACLPSFEQSFGEFMQEFILAGFAEISCGESCKRTKDFRANHLYYVYVVKNQDIKYDVSLSPIRFPLDDEPLCINLGLYALELNQAYFTQVVREMVEHPETKKLIKETTLDKIKRFYQALGILGRNVM